MPGARFRHHGGRDTPQPRRIRGFVEPALLLLLHGRPMHGYALIEGLGELGLGDYPAHVSAIYRCLYDLEASGMLTSQQETEDSAGPPRRVYRLTQGGDDYLAAWVDDLRATATLLQRFLAAYEEHRHAHEKAQGDAGSR